MEKRVQMNEVTISKGGGKKKRVGHLARPLSKGGLLGIDPQTEKKNKGKKREWSDFAAFKENLEK